VIGTGVVFLSSGKVLHAQLLLVLFVAGLGKGWRVTSGISTSIHVS